MQGESTDLPVQNGELTQAHPIQTAYTSGRKKTGSVMQVESMDFPVQNGELMQSRPIQTAYTSRRKKTGRDMQGESPDLPVQNGELTQAHQIQTACTPSNMAAQQPEENGLRERKKKPQQDEARSSSTPTETALPIGRLKPTYMPVDVSVRPTSSRATAQHTEEGTATEKELSTLQLEETVDKVLPERQQVHDFRQQPETEIRDDSSYREEPLTKPEMEIKSKEILQNDNNDLEHDDMSKQQNRKGKTETDAKAGATRHLSRYPNGTSERAIDLADAKVGWTQHPSLDNNKANCDNDLNQIPGCRRIRLNNGRGQDKPSETKTPRQKSAGSKRQNMRKCRQDKTEWRRAKRQGRRTDGETTQFKPAATPANRFPTTPAENADMTKGAPQNMTKQEVLEKIESIR